MVSSECVAWHSRIIAWTSLQLSSCVLCNMAYTVGVHWVVFRGRAKKEIVLVSVTAEGFMLFCRGGSEWVLFLVCFKWLCFRILWAEAEVRKWKWSERPLIVGFNKQDRMCSFLLRKKRWSFKQLNFESVEYHVASKVRLAVCIQVKLSSCSFKSEWGQVKVFVEFPIGWCHRRNLY